MTPNRAEPARSARSTAAYVQRFAPREVGRPGGGGLARCGAEQTLRRGDERRRRIPHRGDPERLEPGLRLRRHEDLEIGPATLPAKPPAQVGGRPGRRCAFLVAPERSQVRGDLLHRSPPQVPRLVEVEVHRERLVRHDVVPASEQALGHVAEPFHDGCRAHRPPGRVALPDQASNASPDAPPTCA